VIEQKITLVLSNIRELDRVLVYMHFIRLIVRVKDSELYLFSFLFLIFIFIYFILFFRLSIKV